MTKHELLSALTNTWQSFIFGLLLPELLTEDAWNRLSGKTITFEGPEGPKIHVGPKWYAEAIMNVNSRSNVMGEFEKVLKRAVVREGHEFILFYCEQTNQFDKYKAVSWFQFARIMRNVVSHKQNGALDKWPDDLVKKGINSVSWQTRTLDISMVGLEISFTHVEALQLLADQINFVKTELV